MPTIKEWAEAQWRKPGVKNAVDINKLRLPTELWRRVKRLEAAMVDAEWDDNQEAIVVLSKEIKRLKNLQEMGETHDLPY